MATDATLTQDSTREGRILRSAKSTSTTFGPRRRTYLRPSEGSSKKIVAQISEMKEEPGWMRQFRLDWLDIFNAKPMPKWGGNIDIDFQDIYYYLKPTDRQGKTWDDVPDEIKETFDSSESPKPRRSSSRASKPNSKAKSSTARSRKTWPSKA